MSGDISGYQDYYEKARDAGAVYTSRIARCKHHLKAIEDSEAGIKKDLPLLKPMMETLENYRQTFNVQELGEAIEVYSKIGSTESQYYNACYSIAKKMLVGDGTKGRCVIIHGIADSGKSYIADFMYRIFDSYSKNEPKGIFDEPITPEEANKQLLIMNEVEMSILFKQKNISNMKKLTEGRGMPL